MKIVEGSDNSGSIKYYGLTSPALSFLYTQFIAGQDHSPSFKTSRLYAVITALRVSQWIHGFAIGKLILKDVSTGGKVFAEASSTIGVYREWHNGSFSTDSRDKHATMESLMTFGLKTAVHPPVDHKAPFNGDQAVTEYYDYVFLTANDRQG
ncbi:hypothetical protein Daus18300_008055 [Diaporthe australafricana]|uniref:Uncharacterized protein n=1 Tax=Diaporthe australafricana TaxID=127596 RepID=A0ABR3WK65_9PEZI